MKNMSDGKSAGLVIMYLKDSRLYPVALSQEQLDTLDLTVCACLKGKINVVNKPIDAQIGNMIER